MSFSCIGLLRQVLAGANWDNRSNCSSRSSNCNNFSSNSWSNNGCRSTSDTGEFLSGALNPRLDIEALPFGKIHRWEKQRLVTLVKVVVTIKNEKAQ